MELYRPLFYLEEEGKRPACFISIPEPVQCFIMKYSIKINTSDNNLNIKDDLGATTYPYTLEN